MTTLGDRIRFRRKVLGLSLDDLAKKAKLSKSYLCELENRKRGVGAETLLAIGTVLGVSLDELMIGTETPAEAGPLTLPASLVKLAQDHDWPFSVVTLLHRLMLTIQSHKPQEKRCGLEDVDWLRFYEAVREFL